MISNDLQRDECAVEPKKLDLNADAANRLAKLHADNAADLIIIGFMLFMLALLIYGITH
jgi:hypothetical protein